MQAALCFKKICVIDSVWFMTKKEKERKEKEEEEDGEGEKESLAGTALWVLIMECNIIK